MKIKNTTLINQSIINDWIKVNEECINNQHFIKDEKNLHNVKKIYEMSGLMFQKLSHLNKVYNKFLLEHPEQEKIIEQEEILHELNEDQFKDEVDFFNFFHNYLYCLDDEGTISIEENKKFHCFGCMQVKEVIIVLGFNMKKPSPYNNFCCLCCFRKGVQGLLNEGRNQLVMAQEYLGKLKK
ncbi:hypothetical protein GOV12_06995 [Candidatus Pacearchaeota archaeon]|nr:hypothetical protein [Candidatus Pacearchaeota archaeon]